MRPWQFFWFLQPCRIALQLSARGSLQLGIQIVCSTFMVLCKRMSPWNMSPRPNSRCFCLAYHPMLPWVLSRLARSPRNGMVRSLVCLLCARNQFGMHLKVHLPKLSRRTYPFWARRYASLPPVRSLWSVCGDASDLRIEKLTLAQVYIMFRSGRRSFFGWLLGVFQDTGKISQIPTSFRLRL